ncbi:transposase [Sphaerochaeta halotolerans]|uniref:transposase n=1 Tax=Sphaerochaeta halotolerans TaxID=2293840 RepID=UPI001371F499|nr:transposase [Sphaerochaeta halotolerans]MXI85232.1 transposase [Sphaerochaeta halotolerans]
MGIDNIPTFWYNQAITIGYKAHIAADDFGVSIAFTVTGACVHDSKLAVPLMKMARQRTDFLYALMDKDYINPSIDAYAEIIGVKAIIDQKSNMGGAKPLSHVPRNRHQVQGKDDGGTDEQRAQGWVPPRQDLQA